MSGLTIRWRAARDGFLFIPGVVAFALILLALGLVQLDRALGFGSGGFFFGGDASAARGILETIAGSLITVAGLAFSLTIVVLALVSSQFSPRATPGFLADRLNQVIAGIFVGTFGYCLVVLRSVRAEIEATGEGFIPRVSVTVAIGLGLIALGLLLVFINHMGSSIQISRLASKIARDTTREIGLLHPEDIPASDRDPRVAIARQAPLHAAMVYAPRPGYVQTASLAAVVAAVDAPGVRVSVRVHGGDFVTSRTVLAELWPAAALTEGARARILRCIGIGRDRSLRGDALYGVRQLADITAKALSPGINDPTTAIDCIGHLRDLLEQLAGRELPASAYAAGDEGALGWAVQPTFEDYLREAFDEAGRYASDNARVVANLLDALRAIARAAGDGPGGRPRVRCVLELADAIRRPALEDARTSRDAQLIDGAGAWIGRSP